MLIDISDRLARAIEMRRQRDKIRRDLQQVEESLEDKAKQLDMLERQLKREQVDVERLEKLSLTGLFYSVLGSRDQQVEKERQEMLAAQLKYQQAKRLVDSLRADRDHLNKQLNDLRGVDEEYASLMDQKERVLRQENSRAAAALVEVSEQIANRKAEAREVDEAIAAANEVASGLNQVIEKLESAEGWGTWDMLGGGLLTNMIKHSRIDEARDAVQDVQARMSRLTRELADVQRSSQLEIQIGELDVFADFFFDGLIMDWIVQSKINDSLDRARQTRERVTRLSEDLDQTQLGMKQDLVRLSGQRAAIIERS